jgi:RecA-family ATPase
MGKQENSDSAITSERIGKEINRLRGETGAFIGKSAVGWLQYAESLPVQKMLFGDLWFENEIAILFADTNVGKTILAVQIADSISRGREVKGFPLETSKQKVLYFDFEQTEKQFAARYSKEGGSYYRFDSNYIRIQPNNDADILDTGYDSFLISSIELSIANSGAKVVIVDNLTFLRSETEKSKNDSPLMRHLKQLQDRYGLSMMILAHTPKRDST